MMLLSLHIVAIAALAGICGSIGYQMGVKEGIRVSQAGIRDENISAESRIHLT